MIHFLPEREIKIHLNPSDEIEIKYIKDSYLLINLKTNQIFLNIEDNFCIFCNESSEIVNFKGFPICKDCIRKLNVLKNSKKTIYFY